MNKFLQEINPRKRVLTSRTKKRLVFNKFRFKRGWLYLYIFFILITPFFQVNVAHAPILPKRVEAKVDTRLDELKTFLEKYNSPLSPYAGKFLVVADKYGFDWRFLPAIAGTESTFGLRYIQGTYNPFGWGSGKIAFSSWENGIETVGKALWEKYLLKGKRPLTIEGIGKIYAESPHWSKSVKLWMGRISSHELASK